MGNYKTQTFPLAQGFKKRWEVEEADICATYSQVRQASVTMPSTKLVAWDQAPEVPVPWATLSLAPFSILFNSRLITSYFNYILTYIFQFLPPKQACLTLSKLASPSKGKVGGGGEGKKWSHSCLLLQGKFDKPGAYGSHKINARCFLSGSLDNLRYPMLFFPFPFSLFPNDCSKRHWHG